MDKKILIITGGSLKKLEAFREPIKKSGLNVTLASFYDITYDSQEKDFVLRLGDFDLKDFDLIYIRMVGKRLEDATLVVNYAKKHSIPIVDHVYENSLFIPSTISKAYEMEKLILGEGCLPRTYVASLDAIRDNAPKKFGFPFVIKSTSGRKARDAWSPKNQKELDDLYQELRPREINGDKFFAQELIKASQRARVLVIGCEVIGAFTRPTKWRKRFTKEVGGEYPEGKKEALNPVPENYKELALKVTQATDLDICGVDILEEDGTGKLYVIEANAAPAWKLIEKDCRVVVEEKVLEFLKRKLE